MAPRYEGSNGVNEIIHDIQYRVWTIKKEPSPTESTIIKKTKTPNHRKRIKGWE